MRLAQWIDCRVGDLCETLLAVVPQRPAEFGHECGRRIVAHAPNRFFSFRQWLQQQAKLVFTPADRGCKLPRIRHRTGGLGSGWAQGKDCRALSPYLLCGDRSQELSVAIDLTGSEFSHQHLSRSQAPAFDDFSSAEVGNAGFRSSYQPAIGSSLVAQRTKAVAIKLRAHDASIPENQRGGPIPR